MGHSSKTGQGERRRGQELKIRKQEKEDDSNLEQGQARAGKGSSRRERCREARKSVEEAESRRTESQ